MAVVRVGAPELAAGATLMRRFWVPRPEANLKSLNVASPETVARETVPSSEPVSAATDFGAAATATVYREESVLAGSIRVP